MLLADESPPHVALDGAQTTAGIFPLAFAMPGLPAAVSTQQC